jgi:hypothetical protein
MPKKIVEWGCKYCGERFGSKPDAETHEKKCDKHIMSIYRTLCGHEIKDDSKDKKKRVSVASRFLKGDKPSTYDDQVMKDNCKQCKARKYKVKYSFMNRENRSLYDVEHTVCMAHRV